MTRMYSGRKRAICPIASETLVNCPSALSRAPADVAAGWLQQDRHCAEQLKPGSVDSQCEDRLVSTRQVQRQKERPGVEPYHGRPRSCRGAVARGPAIEGEA